MVAKDNWRFAYRIIAYSDTTFAVHGVALDERDEILCITKRAVSVRNPGTNLKDFLQEINEYNEAAKHPTYPWNFSIWDYFCEDFSDFEKLPNERLVNLIENCIKSY